jgi:hypothetical protein
VLGALTQRDEGGAGCWLAPLPGDQVLQPATLPGLRAENSVKNTTAVQFSHLQARPHMHGVSFARMLLLRLHAP